MFHQGRQKGKKSRASADLAVPSSHPFIVATGRNIEPDAESRKLIRRYARKGKGKKPNVASSPRPPLGSWINQGNDQANLHKAGAPEADGSLGDGVNGSVLPLRGLGITMEQSMMQPISDFLTSMTRSMHPMESCVDLSEEGRRWFYDMGQDPAYVKAVCYVAKGYFDLISSHEFEQTTILYMNKTIRLVQPKLAEAGLATTDSTLFSVLTLAMIADGLGDPDLVKPHLDGFGHLVKLRGGMAAISHKSSLQIKSCRFDLRFSLQTGYNPLLLDSNDFSWNPYLADLKGSMSTTPIHVLCDSPDIRLLNVWYDLDKFTRAANLAHQSSRKLSSRLVQEAIISVQYRLLYLAYPSQPGVEAMRIAILAFSTTLFSEIHGVSTDYPHLAGQVRNMLQLLEESPQKQWLEMMLWFLFIARLSVLDAPSDCQWLELKLLSTMGALGVDRWDGARQILKKFLWVDIIHGVNGRLFFESTAASKYRNAI